jgi:hypothetical protein
MNEQTSTAPPGSPPATGSEVCATCGRGSVAIAGNRVASLIHNAHSMLAKTYHGRALWTLVSDLTGHGSTESIRLCLAVELDPHQQCGTEAGRIRRLHPPNTEVSHER